MGGYRGGRKVVGLGRGLRRWEGGRRGSSGGRKRGGGSIVEVEGCWKSEGRWGGGGAAEKGKVVFGSMLIGASRFTMLLEINWINYMARMCVAVNVMLTFTLCACM